MKENNIQDNLSMSNIIEEEKNNSYIIPSPKAEKIPLKTKNNYSNIIRSIIETDPRDNEYTNKIRTNPLSLFDYMTEDKLKEWENILFNSNSNPISKLIKTEKSDEKIFSKLNLTDVKEKQVIQNDSLRTRSREIILYPEFQKILYQSLYYYCYKTSANYKQGLNEIFGPLILLKYKFKKLPLYYIINLASAIVDKFFPNYFYEKEVYSLHSAIALFNILLKYHEPTVYNKLEKADVKPELYTMNWFINYQSGKYTLNLFYYFWDQIIKIDDPLFIHFFLIGLIKYYREIIINTEENYLPALISNLPIKTNKDIDNIINIAKDLRNITPYSFRLWANKIGFLRKNYQDVKINYEKYHPDLFMAMPIFPSEILYIMYKSKIKCIDSRCINYINNLVEVSPKLELKQRKEKNNKNKNLDNKYNLKQLKYLAQHHICEKCTMKIEKNNKYLLFDLRMKLFNEETGSLPEKINISQEELKSLDFNEKIISRFLNQRGNYHFIFLSSETEQFINYEKNYYKDNITQEEQYQMLFGFLKPQQKERELNFAEAKKDLNMDQTFKLKEYDNMKKSIGSMIKNNFPYVSYVYGGYEQVHKESKRFKVELINHKKDKCYLCKNKYFIMENNKEEEKTILYEHLWEKKENINYKNLEFFINNPNIKIYLGVLKEYKNEIIEEDKIQILITEKFDKFELELYKFNKEKQYIDFENTIMISDRNKKKEYYDLGKEEDNNNENKNLDLTLIEKIGVNNIISINSNQKEKNIVNILVKDKKSEKIFNKFIKKNKGEYNIVMDFSSSKDSKNFIMSFKSLINLYKIHMKNNK